MKLTKKEIMRRIKLCKYGSAKAFYYTLLFIGTTGYCLRCNRVHAGACK